MLLRFLNIINRTLEGLCNFLLIVMIFVVILQVIFRYLIKSPISWTEEVALLLLVWFSLLSIVAAVDKNSHISVDFIIILLPPRGRHFVEMMVHLMIFLFSLNMAINSRLLIDLVGGEILPASGISRTLLYLAPAISGVLMALNSAKNFLLKHDFEN